MARPRLRIPAGLHGNSAEVVEFITALLDELAYTVPVGGRVDWFAATAPEGFLLLTGQTLDITKYGDLATSGQSDITTTATTITLPVIANKVIKY